MLGQYISGIMQAYAPVGTLKSEPSPRNAHKMAFKGTRLS